MRMLDRQAPDVKIIANRSDDIVLLLDQDSPPKSPSLETKETHHKASINPKRKSGTQEHKSNLIGAITQHTWPNPENGS